MPDDVEVDIDLDGGVRRVGTLYAPRRGPRAPVTFEYDRAWLDDPNKFSLEPALQLGRGAFAPHDGLFGSIGDSTPDTWGRRLMQRAERRRADREGRAIRTSNELDYLLGVSDIARLGALRFRGIGEEEFRARTDAGVPGLIELGRLLAVTERVLRNEETDEDLQLIFAPGSSLGGARPKASVVDQHGNLAIAKFPKETDDYRIELWEAVAIQLAQAAEITVPMTKLLEVGGKSVLLSRRFDRAEARRIPFLSGLSMMGLKDGDHGSYPELVDALTRFGARAGHDAAELFRRMVLNILISNVDDHLRNHGFLGLGKAGWTLSPVYDLNPVPVDVRPRILTTNIDLDDATCDIGLALSVAGYFGLTAKAAKAIISDVGRAVSTWRDVARANGARPSEIERMASAFEHDDLERAKRF
jgi:serine/threonine-protein kinase HipA